jgi:hypothetical protein
MSRFVISALIVMAPVTLAAQPAKEPYAPGLGEFMTATQLRHAKLWFAGRAKNWDLAGYEIDETPPNSFLPMTGFRLRT